MPKRPNLKSPTEARAKYAYLHKEQLRLIVEGLLLSLPRCKKRGCPFVAIWAGPSRCAAHWRPKCSPVLMATAIGNAIALYRELSNA